MDKKENKIMEKIPVEKILFEYNDLSIFQKILLITDGTVTDLLKLYTHKDIIVKKIKQEKLLSVDDKIACENNTPVLRREILLGTENENFIYADSIFLYENMSKSIQNELLETDRPIGLLWKLERLDTFRDINEIKIEQCSEINPYFNVESETPFLARTYTIYNSGKILGMITEKFPITYFKEDTYVETK